MVTSRPASPAHVSTRLTGFLFAVILAVLAPAAPASAQAVQAAPRGPAADLHISGPGTHDDAPRLRGTRTLPPLLAGHPTAPLLPPAARQNPDWEVAVLPAPPAISAAHLAHRSSCHGRSPPPGTGI
jgi:hypothetical protein